MRRKRKMEIYPIVILILAVAGVSMGLQGQNSEAALDASNIFEKNCSLPGCHRGSRPPQGLNLEKDRFKDSLVGVPSRQIPRLKLVDTQNSAQSYLIMKIKGSEGIAGRRMPLNSPPLGHQEMAAVEKWVQSLEGSDLP